MSVVQKLTDNFKPGIHLEELAKKYERTNGAITAELKKQGVISESFYRLLRDLAFVEWEGRVVPKI